MIIYTIENESTGEIFTLTDAQLDLLFEHAPDDTMKEVLKRQILVGSHLELDSSDFLTICYLMARTWLGIKGDDNQAAA